MKSITMLFATIGAGLCASSGLVSAETVEEFYAGKRITLTVGSAAGGDYDAWSRLITRHMGKHMPGQPSFVVQNMPGAGGIIAGNHLYNIAKRDGTVIGLISRNATYKYLIKESGVRFEPQKFNWIGSPELTTRVCVVIDKAPVQRAEDLFETEILMGGAGVGTAVSTIPPLLNRLLGMKMKLVEGYKGATEVRLAMERGEVQGVCQSLSVFQRNYAEDLKSGKLRILFNMERQAVPELKAPSIFQFVKTDEQRQTLTLLSSGVELGRPLFAPPEVPMDRVAALRAGFVAALKDPALRQEAVQQGLEVSIVTGEQVEEMVAELMKTSPEILESAGKLGE
jgi:tripartite-type tricarboxylate transporter receptor subunit TctC